MRHRNPGYGLEFVILCQGNGPEQCGPVFYSCSSRDTRSKPLETRRKPCRRPFPAMGCSQVVRHRFLVSACGGSNPPTPASFLKRLRPRFPLTPSPIIAIPALVVAAPPRSLARCSCNSSIAVTSRRHFGIDHSIRLASTLC